MFIEVFKEELVWAIDEQFQCIYNTCYLKQLAIALIKLTKN